MMNIEPIYTTYLLFAANVLLAAAATLAIVRLQRMTDKQVAFWSSPTGASLISQKNQEQLLSRLEDHISNLLVQVESSQNDQHSNSSQISGMPFDNAVRMARHGASLEELARTCGLSDTEARLLKRVHGAQQATAN